MKTAGVMSAGLAAAPISAVSAQTSETPRKGPAAPPASADAQQTMRPANVQTQDSCGSDFMVDVLKTLDIDYVCGNTSDTVRGLQESIINYGGNRKPEFLTVLHEEVGASMAHGYSKIAKKPLAVSGHGSVGLMHASMAMYNAYCDRTPQIFIGGMKPRDINERSTSIGWVQAALDAGAIVRDFVKWDDIPESLQHFSESMVRAYRVAMTPPYGPVLIQLDSELQERPVTDRASLRIPKLTMPSLPVADAGSVAEIARLLANAQMPMIVAELHAHTQADVERLVELAELVQAPVSSTGRMNFPTHHPLSLRPAMKDVDLLVCLNVQDIFSITNVLLDRIGNPKIRTGNPNMKVVSIGVLDTPQSSNFQNFQRLGEVDLAVSADSAATIPALIEALKLQLTAQKKSAIASRGQKFAALKKAAMQRDLDEGLYAWNASPISLSRLSAELCAAVQHDDWSYVCNGIGVPTHYWKMEKHYHTIGAMGGGGLGYGPGASVGAALANREHGRVSVAVIGDGDFMYNASALWTAAHHRIPLLAVIHNNRAYHQEVMHIQRMANRHSRGIDSARTGCEIANPNIDYATLARSLGVYGEGPISNPSDLGPAIKRALAVVKKGEPALIDVVTQAR